MNELNCNLGSCSTPTEYFCTCNSLSGNLSCPIHRQGNIQQTSSPQYSWTYLTPKGWECPKCSRVYSPNYFQCDLCNNKVKD